MTMMIERGKQMTTKFCEKTGSGKKLGTVTKSIVEKVMVSDMHILIIPVSMS